MNSLIIGLITFASVFGGVLLGLFLRNFLPEHHLDEASKDAVKMGTGVIATITALTLGLLVSSAKNSFDTMNAAVTQGGAKIILLDRVLARYGPQTQDIREHLRGLVSGMVKTFWAEDKAGAEEFKAFEASAGMEDIQDELRKLVPQDDPQRLLQTQALQISSDLLQSRWLIIEQSQLSLPKGFLVVLLFCLTALFACFGLFSPPNKTVISALLVCSISVACIIFLIYELNRPFTGTMKISPAPLIKALEYLGR